MVGRRPKSLRRARLYGSILHVTGAKMSVKNCVALGRCFIAVSVVALTLGTDKVQGSVVNDPAFFTGTLGANDDGSTGLVPIGFTIDFFGTDYSSLYVNNNGNVTFTGPLSTYTPFGLIGTLTPIIAPFFADVDTRGAGSGLVHYGTGTYAGHDAFAVTWGDKVGPGVGPGVGYFPSATDKLNKFQLILVERADTGVGNFDIYFQYDQIQWETGDASGGSGGLGGASAVAGYSNGSSASLQIAGSDVDGGLLDTNLATGLKNNSNVGLPSTFIYTARAGTVAGGDGAAPEPAAFLVWGVLALAFGGVMTRCRPAIVA